jgi:hypothetical protein
MRNDMSPKVKAIARFVIMILSTTIRGIRLIMIRAGIIIARFIFKKFFLNYCNIYTN